ncbi:MAG TPA: serine hydrolase [Terriglobales bacterium]|nr:serine hydrolase [Terriglobales bacterium]
MNHRRSWLVLILILVLTLTASAQSVPSDLDSWVDRTMKTFAVPGVAVAVVKDGKVLVAKGYGVRELGKPARVDEHTLFGIASNTKAFTSAALAMLVDEDKLAWNDPVTLHLPWFAIDDPYITHELTVRDTLSHRSGLGLGAGDLMFFPPSTLSRDEILRHARYLKPASSLRSKYAYNNLMFLAAGQIIPVIAGKSWDEFIKDRIFQPLGMTDSVTDTKSAITSSNHVVAHSKVDGKITPVGWQGMDNAGPAGSIASSVTDLSKWVMLQLNRGTTADGKKLFSEKRSAEMWTPTTIVPISKQPKVLAAATPNFMNYGMGWFLRDYHGRKLVYHTGGLVGQVSKVLLVPEENLGIIVLTNQEQGGAFESIVYHLLDHYLNLPKTDWIAAFREATDIKEKEAAETEQKAREARAAKSRPSLPLDQYSGDYKDAWYGLISIRPQEYGLVMKFENTPGMIGDLEHWQYDSFIVKWRDRTIPDAYLWFALKHDGSIESAKMAPVSPLADFSFDFQDLLLVPLPKLNVSITMVPK